MFCLDKIMLIFKIPKLFHFQRTLMQIHFPLSFTNMDLPALPPIPAEQAGLAQAGREPRSQKPYDCASLKYPHTVPCSSQGDATSEASGAVSVPQEAHCDGRWSRAVSIFPSFPRGIAQATLKSPTTLWRCNVVQLEKEEEAGILKGRAQRNSAAVDFSGVTGFGICSSLTSWSGLRL